MTAPFSEYDTGHTPFYASRLDPRCSCCLYVPTAYEHGVTTALPVVVAVHGTDRPAQAYRDAFAAFAEEHGCLVVAPLFPAGLTEPWELESYKLWRPELLRSDLILLDMLDAISERWRLRLDPVLLYGFSGGGQFALRFLLLHAARLRAVTICAPGAVTLLDPARGWWTGIADVEECFGTRVDVDAIRRVQVQLLIGGADVDRDEPHIPDDWPLWVPGANDAGVDRIERLRTVERDLTAHGVATRFDLVPGVDHDDRPLLATAQAFLGGVLSSG